MKNIRCENHKTKTKSEPLNDVKANLATSLVTAAGSGAMFGCIISNIDNPPLDMIVPALILGSTFATSSVIIAQKGVYDIIRGIYQTARYSRSERDPDTTQEGDFGVKEGVPEQKEAYGIEDWQMYGDLM